MVSPSRPSRTGKPGSSLLTTLLLFTTYASAAAALNNQPLKHSHLHSRNSHISGDSASSGASHVAQQGFKSIGYYVNWAIYGRNWPPQNIQSESLTHVLYAFAGINNKTGEAYLADEFADVQKKFDGDDTADNSTSNLYGSLKQLYLHKKRNRNLKTLLSFGGWSLRTYFAPALAHEKGRKAFAKTSVQLLKDLGFDGLDIDWEYPNNTKQARDLVDTCKEFRAELDRYSRNLTGNPHFLLTLAVPAGPDHFPYFDMQGLAPYVDFVNLMAYDYQGSFSNFSGHNANVYKSQLNPKSTDFATQDAVDYYLGEQGWDKRKFTLGIPMYGRSFANTSGPGTVFAPAADGSWENGVWDYKAVAGNSSFGQVYHDDNIIASYAYNNKTHYLVSYDNVNIAAKKAAYIENLGISGAMWWELSGDAPINGSMSLLGTVTDHFGSCGGLEQSLNVLNYPQSKYKNLRAGMPGQ